MKEVKLRGSNRVALVDDEDFEMVSQVPWYLFEPKRAKVVYAKTNQHHGNMLLHRLITGMPPHLVDHKNGNGLDCQKHNLRPANRAHNEANKAKYHRNGKCKSRFKGVHLHHAGKWVARIHVDRKAIHLGMFIKETDAALAYNKEAIARFGEYAFLNVVEGDRDA